MSKRLEQVRDIFIFSCFTGLAYIDVKNLREKHIRTSFDGNLWVTTKRQKTAVNSNIPLLDIPKQILDKYRGTLPNEAVLPVLSNQKMNAYLKEIGDVCGIEKNLTFHISRTSSTDKYADIRKRIVDIFEEHHKRYGYRRVHMQLVNEGHVINRKTVQKLMAEMHLKSKVRKVKYKSYKGEIGRVAPNVLNRNFKAEKPYQKWATDTTEFKVNDRKAYLSPIIDMFNGEIVSYTT